MSRKGPIRVSVSMTPEQVQVCRNEAEKLGLRFDEFILYACLNRALGTRRTKVEKLIDKWEAALAKWPEYKIGDPYTLEDCVDDLREALGGKE